MADTTKTTRRAATAVLRPGTLTGPAGLQALGLVRFMSDAGAQGSAGADGSGGDAAGESAPDGAGSQESATGGSDDGQEAPGADDQDGDEEGKGSKATDPLVRKARDEAYANRTKAREAEERATAAAKERDDLVRALGKHLGLVTDEDEGGAPDVEELSRTVAAEQAKASEAARELAVFKASAKAGADPERLLDSRRFLASISEIDPTDADAVSAAVKAAVDSDPNLAQRRERGASSADTASGPGGGSAPKAEVGLQAALSNHYGTN